MLVGPDELKYVLSPPEARLPKTKAQAWLTHSKAFGNP